MARSTLDNTAPQMTMTLVSDASGSSTETITQGGTTRDATTDGNAGMWTFPSDNLDQITSAPTTNQTARTEATATAISYPSYTRTIVDSTPIGHDTVEKALVDIRGTGKLDVVVGDGLNGGLWWYDQPAGGYTSGQWPQYKIASGSFYEGLTSYDVNKDGAVDIVASDSGNKRVVWFENPRGKGGNPATATWNTHVMRSGSAHEILKADLDGDGKMDFISTSSGINGTTSGFSFQNTPDSWTNVSMPRIGASVAPFDIGSGKGAINLVGADGNNIVWWENPIEHGANARTGQWTEHYITTLSGATGNSFASGVFSSSGRMDVLTGSSENTSNVGIKRLVAPVDRRNGTWTVQTVASDYQNIHNMVTADMNKDGKLDFVTSEQEQSPNDRVAVFYGNGDGSFTQQVLERTGGQNVQVGDINRDGDLDILNENHGYYGAPNPVEILVNQLYTG